MLESQGSVTVWLQLLKGGDRGEAVSRLWMAYFDRLVRLARDHLRARRRGAADEEDIALSAFNSFIEAAQSGRFPRLEDRNDLWQVLFILTSRKSVNCIEKDLAQKAGSGRVSHLSALRVEAEGSAAGIDFPAPEPTPADAAAMAESLDRMLELLGNGDLKRVVVWRMEGYSNEEIAGRLGRSVATVERKLKAVRSIYREAGIWPA